MHSLRFVQTIVGVVLCGGQLKYCRLFVDSGFCGGVGWGEARRGGAGQVLEPLANLAALL